MAGRKWKPEELKTIGAIKKYGKRIFYVSKSQNLFYLLNSGGAEGYAIINRENGFFCGPDNGAIDLTVWKYCKNYNRMLEECKMGDEMTRYKCMESNMHCDDFIFRNYKTA